MGRNAGESAGSWSPLQPSVSARAVRHSCQARVDGVAVGDADEVTKAFLVGFAALDEHSQPGGVFGEVTDVQTHQFASP
jgi:hypothetical protein